MRTNLEKWDYYKSIIDQRTDGFVNSIIFNAGVSLPSSYYYVYPSGKVVERVICSCYYNHRIHGGTTYFYGKKPTREEVELIKKYSESDIPFDRNNIFLNYEEKWDGGMKIKSSVNYIELINERGGNYLNIADAVIESESRLELVREKKEIQETYKGFDFGSNGFKFLGWQNGWKHVYYDEDGNLCTESGKPRRSFGYSKEDHPEYGKCRELKHILYDEQRTRSGSENIEACPKCKIYWKYDCSD